MSMPNPVFGNWDGAAMAEDAPQIPTPTGSQCALCQHPFQPGDVGMRMGHIGLDTETAVARDWHRECLFLNTCGHSVGICGCTGWDTRSREAALAAWARKDELAAE